MMARKKQPADLRAFAEWAIGHVEGWADAAGQAREPWKAASLDLARNRLRDARILLALPASDVRHESAPGVAMEAVLNAAMLYGAAVGDVMNDGSRERKRGARMAAKAKAAADPKAAAKAGALALWIERHGGKRPNLRTVEQFATEVMRLWPVLTSVDTIRKWSAGWTKQAKAGQQPTL